MIEVMIQFSSGAAVFGATAVVTIPPFDDIPIFSGGRLLLHDFQGFGSHVAGLNLITRTSTTVGLPTATSLASFTGSGTLTINFFIDWLNADGDIISSTAAAPFEVNTTTLASGTFIAGGVQIRACLLYTSPSPRDRQKSRMPSSA